MPTGRPTGTESANRREMRALIRKKFPEYQPVVRMAEHAHKLDELAEKHPEDHEARLAAVSVHDKVANYLTPKLKAIEVTGAEGGAIVIQSVAAADDEL